MARKELLRLRSAKKPASMLDRMQAQPHPQEEAIKGMSPIPYIKVEEKEEKRTEDQEREARIQAILDQGNVEMFNLQAKQREEFWHDGWKACAGQVAHELTAILVAGNYNSAVENLVKYLDERIAKLEEGGK